MSESNSIALQYRISCRNCKYSRFFGTAQLTAHVKATSHAYRMMHAVDVVQINLESLTHTVSEAIRPVTRQKSTDDAPF